jgi:protocatechuate 3,4-dioxygenase beta subunit
MWRHAALTGTIVDEAGDPVVGQEVRALQRDYVGGRSHLRISGANLTDDRGVYRIGQLDPGVYFVVPSIEQTYGAREGQPQGTATIQVGSTSHTINVYAPLPPMLPGIARLMVYPTLFYPGVPSAAQAPPIVLGSGEERANVDFQFLPIPAARVSGRAFEAPPGAHVQLRLMPAELDDVSEAVMAEAFSDANGTFTFPAIPPGDYVLKARSSMGQDNRWAAVGFSVGQQDVSGIDFVLRPGVRISGRVEFSGNPPTAMRQMSVTAEAADGTHVDVPPQAVAPAGRFTIDGLPGGNYVLRLTGIPSGWMLQSATYQGRDVSDVPLRPHQRGTRIDIADGQRALDVTIRMPRGAVLTGTVVDHTGHPLAHTSVAAFRFAYQNGERRLARYRDVQTDERGVYRLYGLAAGEYAIATAGALFGVRRRRCDPRRRRGRRAAALDDPRRMGQPRSVSDGGPPLTTFGYAPVYYPGTPFRAQAMLVPTRR